MKREKLIVFMTILVFVVFLFFMPKKSYMELTQNIPKQIFMKFNPPYEELHDLIKNNIENTKSKNKGYEVRYYSDSEATKFIEENFPEYLDDYNTLVPGAYKADLLRLLFLYKYGGVYNDIGVVYLEPIDSFISNEKLIVCKDSPSINNFNANQYLSNGFIASVPEHPMIKKAIDVVIENIRNRFYGNTPLDPTGPGAFGKAFNLHFGRKEDEPISVGMFDEDTKVMDHTHTTEYVVQDTNQKTVIKSRFDNYYDTIYKEGNVYYAQLWNSKNIFQ